MPRSGDLPPPPENPPTYEKVYNKIWSIIDTPITTFREKIVEPLQAKNNYPYYHRQYRRVPTIDQCGTTDAVCQYEAELQYKRDKEVDSQILQILRQRRVECMVWYGEDSKEKCKSIADDYDEAAKNWFIKYGDMGACHKVKDAYMKQKHRLIYERRHPDWAERQGLPAKGRPPMEVEAME
ncbi:unnamed protein product [Owenia fusiformis]|uniref:NADH dehydrogenase [ubiquinone] 1 beta subcomplex subunit 10 n=1 Tax=Owenia fusiformis TaxID=6347 RepID=A0A8J1UAU9_OWEFU|nr:unnamed protein product [Owenia fusiformis]